MIINPSLIIVVIYCDIILLHDNLRIDANINGIVLTECFCKLIVIFNNDVNDLLINSEP